MNSLQRCELVRWLPLSKAGLVRVTSFLFMQSFLEVCAAQRSSPDGIVWKRYLKYVYTTLRENEGYVKFCWTCTNQPREVRNVQTCGVATLASVCYFFSFSALLMESLFKLGNCSLGVHKTLSGGQRTKCTGGLCYSILILWLLSLHSVQEAWRKERAYR
jgi:hypothetical protein